MPYKPAYSVPEILRLRAEGLTHRQIGQRFSISPSRVGQVIHLAARRASWAEQARAACAEIRATNDFSRQMPVGDLLRAVAPEPRAERLLRLHFEATGVRTLSLRELMDFLLPAVERPRDSQDLMPAYKVRSLGRKLYASLIRSMSALDCGEAYGIEWTARKKRLRDYLEKTGGLYPYILHGKKAALRD